MADKVDYNPLEPTRIKTAAEKNITDALTDAFYDSLGDITDDVLDGYEAHESTSRIVKALNFDAYEDIPERIESSLESCFGEAAEHAIDGVYIHVDDNVKRDDAFDLANADASEYAKTRSAELVGRKWVNGKLVQNPNAKWRITDTTRDGIQSLVEKAYETGLTPAALKEELKNNYVFSDSRASMIARTELNFASSNGTLSGWKNSGVVEYKEWIVGDDHEDEDECSDNEDAGLIPIEDDFPSGDDSPPAHPNCNCSMSATLFEQDEQGSEEEE